MRRKVNGDGQFGVLQISTIVRSFVLSERLEESIWIVE